MNLISVTGTIARNILPPGISKLRQRVKHKREVSKDFAKWWRRYKQSGRVSADLQVMVDYFVDSPAYGNSSVFWNYLNRQNIQQLSETGLHGYEHFKQTVARNYFTWVGESIDTPYARKLLEWSTDNPCVIPVPSSELCRKHSLFTTQESTIHNVITLLLWSYVKSVIPGDLFESLEEPREGDPPAITLGGRRISQDTLNSALEFHSISQGIDLQSVKSVIEVGAGYGRTSFQLLSRMKDVHYTVVDVPPALFVSQTYLAAVFPQKKVFKFRPFESFGEVEKQFLEADICFIQPEQLRLLPRKHADLFIAIDCLHEMKLEQVRKYFELVDQLAAAFYFKCWSDTSVPLDGIRIRESDYPVREEWKRVFRKSCVVPHLYFEAFYNLPLTDGS
jgi:putative sugar O-methyltransferase